jgi:hypothetical protein
MLRTPLTTWWGAATFAIEIAAFIVVGPQIIVSRLWVVILLLLSSFTVFFPAVILIKGWRLYREAHFDPLITQIVRVDDKQVFLIHSPKRIHIGALLELRRTQEDVELPIGIITVDHEALDGTLQASPIWVMPGHMRDIETHKASPQNLTLGFSLTHDALERWIDNEAEAKVQDLLRTGVPG